MRRVPFALATIALAGLPPLGAAAFNPSPRPAPGGVDTVCADDVGIPCCASKFSGGCDPPSVTAAVDCASKTCVGDPADLGSPVAVRGTLTFISDEDVTGWDDGVDGSTDKPENARLTVLIQYERNGVLRTFAEIYKLGNVCAFGEIDAGEPFLCVPEGVGWDHPASEAVITDPQFNVVFSSPGDQAGAAIAKDLTGSQATTLRPYLDIVDRLPETTSSHSGTDPLASVQQHKVTIRLYQP